MKLSARIFNNECSARIVKPGNRRCIAFSVICLVAYDVMSKFCKGNFVVEIVRFFVTFIFDVGEKSSVKLTLLKHKQNIVPR